MPKSPSKPKTQKTKSPAEIPPKLAPLSHTTLAFCDGACKGNPGKGGFGTVIILPDGEQIDIYGGEVQTTNNRMELMGAISALAHSPPELPIQIWTDSGYVKDGITQWLAGWKARGWKKADKSPVLNQELWQQLDQACQNRVISWHWLKGHAGHDGNEYADTLANLGITHLPTPMTIKKKRLKSNVPTINPNYSNEIPQNAMTNNSPAFSNTHTSPNSIPENMPSDANDSLMGMIFSDNLPDADLNLTDMDLADLDLADLDLNNSGYADNNDYPPHSEPYIDESDYQHSNPDFSHNALPQNPMPHPQNLVNSPTQNPNMPINRLFQDEKGQFFAQDEATIAQRPEFDGNTQIPNLFMPLLPLPKHKAASNRQLILDTETTGFEATNGDRIIEIGIVELINRKFTGEKLHVYINPNKEMGEEVIRIHGITNAFLADKPPFEQIGQVVYDFMLGAELVAHNAPFDMSFLVAEFSRLGLTDFASQVTVIDSLVIAKQQYAGQRNTLDALVKRLNVGKQDRTFHGALLDAEILAEVYLAMTGGQVSLGIDDSVGGVSGTGEHQHFNVPVARFVADDVAEQAHLAWINTLKDQNPELLERWGLVEPAEPVSVEN